MKRFVLFYLARFALTLLLALAALRPAAAADDALPALRHGYADNRYGQLHFAIAQPARPGRLPAIVLFHQSPNSSAEFHDLLRALGRDRVAIAVDTPGYGGSDGPADIPSIEDYAASIAEALHRLGYGNTRPIDVFGYHTGSKIATELAVTEPRMIRRVVLSGLYDPPPAQLAKALADLHHPTSVTDMLERFYQRLPETRAYYAKQGLSETQWGPIRIDSLRAMTHQEYGHEAAFRYAPRFAARMGQVKQPVLLLPMDDGLAAATRDAAAHFSDVRVEAETFAAGGFFTQTAVIAAAINAFSGDPLSERKPR